MKPHLLAFGGLLIGFLFITGSALAAAPLPTQPVADILGAKTVVALKSPASLPRLEFGQNISITTDTDRDLITAGKSVTVTGKVNGDLITAGAIVDIKGEVTNNLIVAGANVTIEGTVDKNVIVAAGDVKIAPNAHINGYLLSTGGSLTVAGKIDGSVKFTGSELTFVKGAVVGGEFQGDVEKVTGVESAQIGGSKNITISETKEVTKPRREAWAKSFTILKLIEFLGKLVVLVALIFVLGKHVNTLTQFVTSPATALGWGLVKLVVVPVAIVLMMITFVGIPLGALTLVVYIISLYLSQFVVAMAVGRLLGERLVKNSNLYLQGSMGLILLIGLSWIPVVGWVVKLISLLIGLGAIWQWERLLLARNK